MKITLLKGVAALQALFSLSGLLVEGNNWSGVSIPVVGGLAIFFLSREAVHDERVDHLKLKAISLGFSLGLIITIWVNVLSKILGSIGFRLTLSAFDAMIIILLTALAFFHYWRWQDGRETIN